MKCTNPRPCDGEMLPMKASDTGNDCCECWKCGFRTDPLMDSVMAKEDAIIDSALDEMNSESKKTSKKK